MDLILEVIDKTGRKIHLSKERWKHIRKKHPEIENEEQVKETIEKPDKITQQHQDETIYYYYKYQKHRLKDGSFILVIVKYLNGNGYVTSAYSVLKIK